MELTEVARKLEELLSWAQGEGDQAIAVMALQGLATLHVARQVLMLQGSMTPIGVTLAGIQGALIDANGQYEAEALSMTPKGEAALRGED